MRGLSPFGCSLSFDVLEVLQGHAYVFPFVNLDMAGFTKWHLFTIYGRHHFPSPPLPPLPHCWVGERGKGGA